jgi:hypothetical protein
MNKNIMNAITVKSMNDAIDMLNPNKKNKAKNKKRTNCQTYGTLL